MMLMLTSFMYSQGYNACFREYKLGMTWGIRFALGRSWDELKEDLIGRQEEFGWDNLDLWIVRDALTSAREDEMQEEDFV